MTNSLPLSILDLAPVADGTSTSDALRHILDLARLGDELGYTRLWYAEHHGMPSIASSSPEVLIASAAAATSRIRVGSGGVMLPNHVPLRVVETYRTLNGLKSEYKGERLSYSQHGGPEGGLECGARLSLASLELDVDTNGALREFAGVHDAVRAAVTPR